MLTCCVYPGCVFSLSKLFSPVSMCEKWNKSQMGTSAQGHLGVCKRKKKICESLENLQSIFFCLKEWIAVDWGGTKPEKCLSSFQIFFFFFVVAKTRVFLRASCYDCKHGLSDDGDWGLEDWGSISKLSDQREMKPSGLSASQSINLLISKSSLCSYWVFVLSCAGKRAGSQDVLISRRGATLAC